MEKFNVLSLTEKQKTPLLRGSCLNPKTLGGGYNKTLYNILMERLD